MMLELGSLWREGRESGGDGMAIWCISAAKSTTMERGACRHVQQRRITALT